MGLWEEYVVNPMEETYGTVSDEFKECMSGGCDPGRILNKALRRSASGIASEVGEEARVTVDDLFVNHVDPLVEEINLMAKDRITQTADRAEQVVEKTARELDTIKDELREDIEALVANVDERLRDNMRYMFDRIAQALTETIVALRATIADIDARLEARIKQLALIVMEALATVDAIVQRTFDRLAELENKLAEDLNAIWKKIDRTILSAQAWANLIRQRIADFPLIPLIPPGQLRTCFNENSIPIQSGPSLAEDEIYALTKCMRLKDMEREIEEINVDSIIRNYGFLQGQAWDWLTMNRGVEAQEKQYARDYLYFGAKAAIWAAVQQ